jgi:hypothetical protein
MKLKNKKLSIKKQKKNLESTHRTRDTSCETELTKYKTNHGKL